MHYKNFYETLAEALMRIRGTIIIYDKEPYYVWTITDHTDGHFRVYMSKLEEVHKVPPKVPSISGLQHGHSSVAQLLDPFVETVPELVRKKLESNKFEKFRPFPLGMANFRGCAYYVERRPNRPKTEQGLMANAMDVYKVSCSTVLGKSSIDAYTTEFRDCIVGDYPTPKQCLDGLTSELNDNESVAFHRNFALVKGPINTMFLAYREEIVGALPRSDFSELRLGKHFKHLKEAARDLRLFTSIS